MTSLCSSLEVHTQGCRGVTYRLQEKDFGLRYRSEFFVGSIVHTPPRISLSGLAKLGIRLREVNLQRTKCFY